MRFKTAPAKVKNTDADTGVFEALVSVFDNIDSYGDVVVPGAFAKTLAEWEETGSPIPVLFSHRMDDPNFNIGHVLEAKETDDGLYVKAQIDLDMANGALVHRQLKSGRLRQFSFAYDEVDAGPEKRDDLEVRALRELKLYEVGPTLIGANQETELLAVKSTVSAAEQMLDGISTGRSVSAEFKTELLSTYHMLGNILMALGHEDIPEEKASVNGTAKSEEPDGAKDEEPSRDPHAKNPGVQFLRLQETADDNAA